MSAGTTPAMRRHRNPIGVHALVWVAGWSEQECRHAIAQTAEAGFDLLEIPLLDPAEVNPATTARFLEGSGITATYSLGLPFAADVSSPDPDTSARGERLLLDALEVVARVGGSYLGGILYSAMGKYPGRPSDVGRANAVAALRRVAERAARDGVTLGLEPVNRYESNLVNTAEQALELINDIGASNVVVHLDSYHMHIEECDLAEPVRDCSAAGRLGYIHVGESHRGYLGSGSVDFPQLFRALADASYAGPIVFESFSSAVVSPQFASALAVWRDPWRDGMSLAAHARAFIEAQLAAALEARPPNKEGE